MLPSGEEAASNADLVETLVSVFDGLGLCAQTADGLREHVASAMR